MSLRPRILVTWVIRMRESAVRKGTKIARTITFALTMKTRESAMRKTTNSALTFALTMKTRESAMRKTTKSALTFALTMKTRQVLTSRILPIQVRTKVARPDSSERACLPQSRHRSAVIACKYVDGMSRTSSSY